VQLFYIARRFGVFLLIVWLAATLNFFLPKLSGEDPVRTKLLSRPRSAATCMAASRTW
jgi:ABC-type dipeptide/oligopeptide/nickel transport system permease component